VIIAQGAYGWKVSVVDGLAAAATTTYHTRMDFERVLKALLDELQRQRVRYGAIGGFALVALGVPRMTLDVDFLVHRDDLTMFDQSLQQLGYRRVAMTENVSHYRHADRAWGSIDVLHAFRPHSLAMLERAAEHPLFGATQHLKVLQPEDIIGLKIQAMANDPLRQLKERTDIEALAARYGPQLDWRRVREYYALFELDTEAQQLQERFGHAQ